MLSQLIVPLFTRDLQKLRTEIELYQDESNLWKTEKNITNSAGNLCLHLVGNLNHFIGNVLGNSGYIRNRELEFTDKNVPKSTLLQQIDETKIAVINVLSSITQDELEMDYPLLVLDQQMTTNFFILHLMGHLTYHLGQINYHRRMLDY